MSGQPAPAAAVPPQTTVYVTTPNQPINLEDDDHRIVIESNPRGACILISGERNTVIVDDINAGHVSILGGDNRFAVRGINRGQVHIYGNRNSVFLMNNKENIEIRGRDNVVTVQERNSGMIVIAPGWVDNEIRLLGTNYGALLGDFGANTRLVLKDCQMESSDDEDEDSTDQEDDGNE